MQYSVRIHPELLSWVKEHAKRKNVTVTSLIVKGLLMVLREELEPPEKEAKLKRAIQLSLLEDTDETS